MVRAPCCEKMGLKRGPWTPDEDQVLISYIQRYGHGNWRALPKQAGLLRCGKSCRLRWTNYLRPDIKRGNFTREEEDTIIKLHQMLGNRWSAIAARLPGRTDNEIKNVWHTHLKKKLKQNLTASDTKRKGSIGLSKCEPSMGQETKPKSKSKSKSKSNSNSNSNSNLTNLSTPQTFEEPGYIPLSPPQSSSEFSNGTESISTSEKDNKVIKEEYLDSWDTMPHFDENLWSQVMPMESFNTPNEFSTTKFESRLQFPFSSTSPNYCSNMDDSMDFWYDVFTKAEEFPELPEF